MTSQEKMRNLINTLNSATVEYDKGIPIMTDKYWDNLYFELLGLERDENFAFPDSPTQQVYFETVSKLKKVEHNHKMLSLDKTKDVSVVQSFMGNDKTMIAMWKVDGLTCSLTYEDGVLVRAETRGNGLIGEDILHNAKVIPSIPKIMPKGRYVIDGEIICKIDDFQSFTEDYKHPRNFASGSIRLLDAKECQKRKLTFVAWDVIEGIDGPLSDRLTKLINYGFTIVNHVLLTNKNNVQSAIDILQESAEKEYIPIDGVVFKYNDKEYGKSLGETAHHFKDAIALKFYDEVFDTFLKDIEWTMGRTGVLTPVAVFAPVDIDGTKVERASLHNISILKETLGTPFYNQPIKVFKANMIIPQIYSAKRAENITTGFYHRDLTYMMEYPDVLEYPTTCPVCGGKASIKESDNGVLNLICENPNCEGKLVNRLDHFLGKKGLDVKGLSRATLEKLIEWGWVNNITDIYGLIDHAAEWKKKPGFGEKSVENILTAIENSTTCSLDKFICAIGIPLIGTANSKQIAEYFTTWKNFRMETLYAEFDFCSLPDFGIEKENAIYNFNYTEADQLAALFDIEDYIPQTNTSNKLSGKKVVITGSLKQFKNRSELQAAIEQAGGKVLSSISKNVDILINNDIESTSSKNVAAKKLGIPILSEAEFFATYLD